MPRKSILIPLAVVVTTGAIWASSIITPDKPGFPSLPDGVGTLGYVLTHLFGADGTAVDSTKLGGIGSSGYMKSANCGLGESWKGVDASGRAICKGPPLAFAEIIEGSIKVNGILRTAGGDPIHEGDKLETDNTQTGTIRFYNNPGVTTDMGDSIARLGTGTTVLVDRGDTAGTLALITLQDGLLWGRVLTSTGIDFGGGGVIAGVRGTSISIQNPAINQYQFTIPHSQHSTEAATLSTQDAATGENSRTVGVLGQVYVYSGASYIPTPGTIPDLATLYNMDPWVRENTIKDIMYLYPLSISNINAQRELQSTEPTIITDRQTMCTTTTGIWYQPLQKCVYAYAELTKAKLNDDRLYSHSGDGVQIKPTSWTTTSTSSGAVFPAETIYLSDNGGLLGYECPGSVFDSKKTRIKSGAKPVIVEGKWYQTSYIKGLLGYSIPAQNTMQGLETSGKAWVQFNNSIGTKCDSSGNDTITYNIVTRKADITNTTTEKLAANTSGIMIDGKKYIQYPTTGLSLAGKTITIEFTAPPILTANHELLNLGSGFRVAYILGQWQCKLSTTGNFSASNCPGILTPLKGSNNVFTINIPNTAVITQFKIGNSDSGNSFINGRVNKILIR